MVKQCHKRTIPQKKHHLQKAGIQKKSLHHGQFMQYLNVLPTFTIINHELWPSFTIINHQFTHIITMF